MNVKPGTDSGSAAPIMVGATGLKVVDPALRFIELLGTRVYPLTIADLHDLISAAIAEARRVVIASQNLHGIYVFHRSEAMRSLHRKALPRIDGMPLVFLGRLLGYPVHREHRVTWVDWMEPLMVEASRKGWRVFYLGGRPGVVDDGVAILRARVPELEIQFAHGHFDARPGSPENEAVLAAIEAYEPHILLVGMGMPRQEAWIDANLDRLHVNAVLTCGAAIEYVAGAMPTPPRWMGRFGLEWLYRLGSDPRRLAKRYLIEPWSLSGLFVSDVWRRWGGAGDRSGRR